MSSSSRHASDGPPVQQTEGSEPPTCAAFSPATLAHPTVTAQRSTILVHQKSPLLLATPPQITRALAYAHPFITTLNKAAGLLSWTTGDPWESFLLLAAFWAITLYADPVIRWTGPVVTVMILILGMYTRRYSALSSTSWTADKGEKSHRRGAPEASTRHHKSLDEIVDELKLFTSRCNILLDPWLRLTDYLSTQRTATSATTRPALTALFVRILLVLPIWIALALPPLYIITTRRVLLTAGTVALTWHSRPARVARTILWRSRTVRRVCASITGLEYVETTSDGKAATPPRRSKNANEIAASLAAKRSPNSPGIRFTFTLYENQRRWLGIGWTGSLLPGERTPWTDEELNRSVPTDQFDLPEVEGGHARWRWAHGSQWHVEGLDEEDNLEQEKGWVYYDNKWKGGRRDKDGWGRYTRRRKWCRDAELVEVTPSTDPDITPSSTPRLRPSSLDKDSQADADADSQSLNDAPPDYASQADDGQSLNGSSSVKKRTWFKRASGDATSTVSTVSGRSAAAGSGSSLGSRRDEDDDVHRPLHHCERDYEWRMVDDVRMGLE